MNALITKIVQAIRSFKSSVEVARTTTEDEVCHAIRQVMRDNPDLFWFSHQWHYSQENANVRFRYTIDKEHSDKIQTQIDDVVQKDFKLDFVRTLSVREQVMYVFKWIALYCNFNIHSAHNQTIYSVFVQRNSVCTGIAKAAQYLLKLLGIESRLVFGKMNNSEKDSRHCWLIVNIEEQWYHLDPTFAIPETDHLLRQCGVKPLQGDDCLFYNFFCVDTATIKLSRTIEEEEFLPECNERVDYATLQNITVYPSRNGQQSGLGCLLSDVGTTANIYLAHDKWKSRSVAKVFKDDSNHELLRKELIIMRECAGSPNLLRATDVDFDKGILYMEQATPLAELIASHYYKLTVKGFCNLLIDVASGLKDLLCHGIIYRDIHINNIYLWTDSLFGTSAYKLGDFGSCAFTDRSGKYAGLTERGGVGSKWYMAPETFSGMVFDERSAVYGVGMIAYYLLNDLYPPFWQEYGEDSFGMRMQSLRVPIPSKLQEKDFCQLRMDFIFVSLNHNPSERYQTLSELIDAIKECRGINPDNIVVVGNRALTELRTEIKTEESRSWEEDFFWKEALSSHKIESLMIYLERFPQGLHQREARNLIQILEQQQLEEEHFWKEALSSHKIESLMMYLDRFPQGSHCFEARSLICNFHRAPKQWIDDSATTYALESHDSPPSFEKNLKQKKTSETYFPCRKNNLSRISMDGKESTSPTCQSSNGLFGRLKKLLFGKTSTAPVYEETSVVDIVNSSIFAPSEIKRGDYMLVQVFLYRDDEERAVTCKAAEVDPDARRQNYTPLSVNLKEGDKVKAKLTISGKDMEVDESIQEMIWQGHYTDCQFGVFVSEDYKPSSMIGTVMLTVNDIPCGRMMFKTKIVSQPQKLYAKIESKAFQKIFISYSHKDESTVKFFAKAFQAQGVDYFFDRHYLKAGDVYPLKIKEYINSADLFILCWSKNAAESDYVQLERQQALTLAFPQKDMEQATLSIHPISIEPHADYPSDMKEVYNFEEI
ncbi:TIR domain-containing protein [uncultured Prevotella sp.]|uniref:protein kinase domain-containing protein n=1 Tax=uncultured Prevotella sp. TaxID=159272 RepID=UPI00259AB31D|nr:TIR domain-containing protein [uncultured Prevotella sp.]